MDTASLWLGIGFFGQALFSARFILQWVVSEKRRASVTPVAFWYFSLAGGVILLSYAIHRRDTVFIVGQAAGLVVYVRNLMLITKSAAPARSDGPPPAGADSTEP
jgi:lipid-A-disaccharide synthase-like uncharacterized protein